VSFNGKSFDAPVLETRYLFHRLEWPGARLPHVDLLHPARRFWGAPRESSSDCSLIALERSVLGASRVGDIAGFEIPSRFFHFLRCGDPLPLEPVLHHNRLDLLSLAALSTRLLHLLKRGPSSTSDPAEAYAVGRTYARSGLDARAIEAFRCAACLRPSPALKIDVLRSLALMLRRMRRFDEAADIWCQTIALPGCPGHIAREASQALAVHHEHRVRDLAAAKAFALGTLDDRRPAWDRAARHRLSRLEKKIERTANASQPSLPSSS
jgi:hypothetical protein